MAENNPTNNPFLSENEAKNIPEPSAAPKTLATPSQVEPFAVSENPTEVSSTTIAIPSVRPIAIKGPALDGPSSGGASLTGGVSKRSWRHWGMVIVLALLIGGGVYRWWQRPAETPAETVTPTETEPQPTTSTPTVTEEVPPVLLEDLASYKSENFKAGEIVFLGDTQFLLGDEGVEPLTLEGIRGEAFTEKNKQEVKLVITWKTNKLSSAEIAYAKGIGQTPKTVTEDDYSYNHSVILTGLDPASTYLYTVKAADRFGNVVTSEPYAVFTGARSVSLFDLIAGAIGDVFGWAVK